MIHCNLDCRANSFPQHLFIYLFISIVKNICVYSQDSEFLQINFQNVEITRY